MELRVSKGIHRVCGEHVESVLKGIHKVKRFGMTITNDKFNLAIYLNCCPATILL